MDHDGGIAKAVEVLQQVLMVEVQVDWMGSGGIPRKVSGIPLCRLRHRISLGY
jgi:hypothetical protein